MSYSRVENRELSKRIGRSQSCLWRWASEGCDLRSHASVQRWIEKNKLREPNVAKARRRGVEKAVHPIVRGEDPGAPLPPGNGELPPARQKGAQHALSRLESQEAAAYKRLQLALQRGSPLEIENAQMFWVRCVETLRKLDLSIELARREAEQQIPLRAAQDVILFTSEWLRIAIMQLLSSEGTTLAAGFPSVGALKSAFIERFKGCLDFTLKSSLKTNSPVPSWALQIIKEAWNIRTEDSKPEG